MKRRRLGVALALLLLVAALAACGTPGGLNSGVVLVEDGAAETQAAQTAWAQRNPSPTPGPSPTASPEPSPYIIPTNPPGTDPATVITRVGRESITLGEFQKRVRYERWYPLNRLADLAAEHGPEALLDLTRAENQNTLALFTTLADSNSFGVQVHRILVIEAIALEEATRRDLELDPLQFDAELAKVLGLSVGPGGALPPGFEDDYAAFLDDMRAYTGMTEEEFRHMIRARVYYNQLKLLIGQEPGAVSASDDVNIGRRVEDILVSSEAMAVDVAARLRAGEAMGEITASLGLTSATGEASRTVRRSDPTLPDTVLEAIFSAQVDEVVGPFALPEGWYVARVGREVFEVPSPQEVGAIRERYFLDWVEARMDDPSYTEDYENWFAHIPQEPLPQDVSPLLREENMILPTAAALPPGLSLEASEASGEPEGAE